MPKSYNFVSKQSQFWGKRSQFWAKIGFELALFGFVFGLFKGNYIAVSICHTCTYIISGDFKIGFVLHIFVFFARSL